MKFSVRQFIAILGALFLLGTFAYTAAAQPNGFVEGHLKIFSNKEVDLMQENPSPQEIAEDYRQFPLIVRTADGQKEVRQITADTNGNYRVPLPPGNYILDVQRQVRTRLRAQSRPFSVEPNQTVHVDLEIDTGVR